MCASNIKFIDPFTDFGFKHIFGREENKRFLISFLNDLLELESEIVDLEYRNLEKLGLSPTDRKAIYDIYCTDSRGDKFIVELQRSPQKYFKDRSIYYTTFPIQEQSEKGDWDYRLDRVYFIGILEFSFDDRYLIKAQIKDENNDLFYDKLTYYYIQIKNFQKGENELSNHLDYWLWYLKNLAKAKEIPKTLQKDKILSEAFNVAKFLQLSKDEQFEYQMDLKARLDYQNILNFAKESSFRAGEEKGKKENQVEIVKTSLQNGLPIELIAKITGLSVEEVNQITIL
jgi:predicted transposase/invertase (TIGR01784 family)